MDTDDVSDARPKRKHIPMAVKLEACLLMMGLDPKKVDWDHHPALGLRPVNDDGTDYDPPQLDPRYIMPRERDEDHKFKTFGRKGESRLSITGDGDVSRIAKAERLEKARRDMLHIERGERVKPERPKSQWPKGRKLQSRGFQRRPKREENSDDILA